mmetsp:Transcript_5033/g.13421  ORF Transcript_5033/g.13421 Transcript_5033/m.13421 type:complete len:561 (+) Transcript_5033:232-1914(+)
MLQRKRGHLRRVHVGALHVHVHGAHVVTVRVVLVRGDWDDLDHREQATELLWLGVHHHSLVLVPASALHGQAVDVRALLGVLLDVARLQPGHFGVELHDVEGQLVRAGVHLLDGGDERLGVEETGQPNRLGALDRSRGPLVQLRVALLHVLEPARQGVNLLNAGGHLLHPARRHAVAEDAVLNLLHRGRHVQGAVETEGQLLQRALDEVEQVSHAARLLKRAHDVGVLILDAALDVDEVERLRAEVVHVVDSAANDGIHVHGAAAVTAAAALHVVDGFEQNLSLGGEERELRVEVQTVDGRGLLRQLGLHHVLELVVAGGVRGDEAGSQLLGRRLAVGTREKIRGDEHIEVGDAESPVHGIGDVSAVEHLAEHVPEILPGDVVVALEVVEQNLGAVDEVAHVEGVAAAVTETGPEADADTDTELLAAEQQRVVETQRKEDGGVNRLLLVGGGAVEHVLAERREGAAHVGLQVRGRLVGNLDARLQDGLGHNLGEGRAVDGLRAEEAAEIPVRRLCGNLQLALEMWDPTLHEVDVVQEDPTTLLGVLVQHSLGDGLLTLSH